MPVQLAMKVVSRFKPAATRATANERPVAATAGQSIVCWYCETSIPSTIAPAGHTTTADELRATRSGSAEGGPEQAATATMPRTKAKATKREAAAPCAPRTRLLLAPQTRIVRAQENYSSQPSLPPLPLEPNF